VTRVMGGIVHHVDVRKADPPDEKPAEQRGTQCAPRSTSLAEDACASVRDDLASIVWVFIIFSSFSEYRLPENARDKIVDKQQ
jgi:hypothetical protein